MIHRSKGKLCAWTRAQAETRVS